MRSFALLSFCALVPFSLGLAQSHPSPRAGEIALYGEILALDGAKKQLTLRAYRFSLPLGQSKAIAPAKTRIAVFPPGFRDVSLLKLGQNVVLVGKNGAANTPFATRDWILEGGKPALKPAQTQTAEANGNQSKAAEAPDIYTPPALAPLLGPSKSAFGVKLRVVDAGFADQITVYPTDTWSATPQTGFFASVKIESPRSKRQLPQIARFQGFKIEGDTDPNGYSRSSYATFFPGEIRYWNNVSPETKEGVLQYEVVDPNAPADAEGVFTSTANFTDIEIPAKDQTVTFEKPQVATTSRGSKIKLTSITGNGQNSRFILDIEKAPGTPELEFNFAEVIGETSTGETLRGNINRNYPNENFQGYFYVSRGRWKDAPEGTKKTVSLRVRVRESAPSWKKTQFFQTIELPVPVSALYQLAPPVKRPFPIAPLQAESASFTASLEPLPLGQNGWQGLVWLREKTPSGRRLRLQSIKYTLPGKSPQESGNYGERAAFHLDNTPKAADESVSGVRLYFDEEGYALPNFDFRAEVVAEKINARTYNLKSLALPAPGETKTFDDVEIGDEMLTLKAIRWAENPASETQRIKDSIENRRSLLLVFDVLKTRPDAYVSVSRLSGKTDLAPLKITGWGTSSSNLLDEKGTGITLRFDAPAPGSKTLDLNFETQENDDKPLRETLEWKAIPMGKRVEREMMNGF